MKMPNKLLLAMALTTPRQRSDVGIETKQVMRTMLKLLVVVLIPVVAVSCGKSSKQSRSATPGELERAFQAIQNDETSVLRKMVEDGVNLDTPIPDGPTPLSGAAAGGKSEALTFLIKQGCSVVSADKRGMTPLHYAALYGRTNTISILLANGAKVNATDFSGLTPLHCAATGDDPVNTCALLIAHGADVHAKDGFGADPAKTAELNNQNEAAVLIRKHMK